MKVKNRKCIWRLSFRSLWMTRKRNVIAVIAIILTALLFTSLFTIVMSINSSFEMYNFRQIGGYCHGSFNHVSEKQIQEISAHENVKAVGKRKVIGYIEEGVFAENHAEISFMDENCAIWSFSKPDVGRMAQGENEITMDTRAMELLGVEPEIGSEITFSYYITGENWTLYKKTDTFTLVGWWQYDNISPVHYMNVSWEYVERIEAEEIRNGMEVKDVELNVMMASSMGVEKQMEQVVSDLGYVEENEIGIGVNWGYTSAQLEENMDFTKVIAIGAFVVLVSFAGYLIIYNIFQISVTGDIRFYGLLKTIGVTSRQLKRIIRQQALLLCAVGIPLGLLAGYGVGLILTPVIMKTTTLGAEVTTFSTSPWIFFASVLFVLITVLLSCNRPGEIAGAVAPVEATKYTEIAKIRKRKKMTRGAKVYQMAFANLGRNKRKTFLVVISLALSVVLFNILFTFIDGFDMEKYLARTSCSDFIVSKDNYFAEGYTADNVISQDTIKQIELNTSQTLSGCAYSLYGQVSHTRVDADMGRKHVQDTGTGFSEGQTTVPSLVEGFDDALFEKLTVLEGDISPLFEEGSNAIALVVEVDNYGNPDNLEYYPKLGEKQTILYCDDIYFIDSLTGERVGTDTQSESKELYAEEGREVEYTVCALVTLPYSMSYRFFIMGYDFILPAERMKEDSGQEIFPIYYLFDTSDEANEKEAEAYLAKLTSNDTSGLMYESKAKLRATFKDFRNMFMLLGGLLCAIIGLIGILNFFNTIMTGILSRKREFAVLQAVGMTNKQLKTMLVLEGIFYALSSALVAFLLSVLLNPPIGDLLETVFWFYSSKFTVVSAILMIPIFVLIGWFVPTIIYGQTQKSSVVERLREV